MSIATQLANSSSQFVAGACYMFLTTRFDQELKIKDALEDFSKKFSAFLMDKKITIEPLDLEIVDSDSGGHVNVKVSNEDSDDDFDSSSRKGSSRKGSRKTSSSSSASSSSRSLGSISEEYIEGQCDHKFSAGKNVGKYCNSKVKDPEASNNKCSKHLEKEKKVPEFPCERTLKNGNVCGRSAPTLYEGTHTCGLCKGRLIRKSNTEKNTKRSDDENEPKKTVTKKGSKKETPDEEIAESSSSEETKTKTKSKSKSKKSYTEVSTKRKDASTDKKPSRISAPNKKSTPEVDDDFDLEDHSTDEDNE